MIAKQSIESVAIRKRLWVSLRNSWLAVWMMAVISDLFAFFGCAYQEEQRRGRSAPARRLPPIHAKERRSDPLSGRPRERLECRMLRPVNIVCCVLATLITTAAHAAPTAEESLAAFQTARATFDALEAPEIIENDAPGAAVTLRVGGRVVGHGSAYNANSTAFEAALRAALADFLQSDFAPRDATRRERLSELARGATLEVELAGDLVPVGGATFAQAALSFSPGLDGAAARVGDRTEAVFPARMLAAGVPPSRGLTAACAQLGLEPQPLEELRQLSGARVFRFRSVSVGQIEPGGAPVFLHRGGRVRPLSSVVGPNLQEFGESLAAALRERVWTNEGVTRLLGTYDPVRDEHEPLVADARQHALAALALARWARATGDRESARAAYELLGALEEMEFDARSAGMAALAIDALGSGRGELAARCLAIVRAVKTEAPVVDRALAAAVLASRDRDAALAHTRSVLAQAGRGGIVSAAPWVVWAAGDLADGGAVPGAPALREGRELIEEHRITRADAGADEADLVGGVVFTASSQPLPTAQSVRAAAMGAAMLNVPGLTPESERSGELARLLPTLRFLRQLAVGEAEARIFPTPKRALGGVRLALWDQRQPVEATALALITVEETLRAAR